MKVLIGITYYLPNISGLTIYARRLAKELVKRGHQVTVLTSRHDNSLPRREIIDGVEVVRSPVIAKIGKGVIMPLLPWDVLRLVRKVDVINCHLPQFESFIFAGLGKICGREVILTHHTDLSGWKGLFNQISESTVWAGQLVAGFLADKILPYTKDYADYSWYLRLFKKKLKFVYPPILVGKVESRLKQRWQKKIGRAKYIIGFAGRIARQKGIPHLLKAIAYLKKDLASFKIVFAGPYRKVIGENYLKEIDKLINRYRRDICFLGNIPEEKMASFYSLCDVLVLPSDDRLESFGIVQVEAMLNGCPVVASNLPGVRIPIRLTKMGLIVPPGDSQVLAKAMVKVLKNKNAFLKLNKEVKKIFNFQKTIDKYEKLFQGS